MLTNDTKAVLLLCAHLGGIKTTKPLTITEYEKLTQWLKRNELRPSSLLHSDITEEATNALVFEYDRLPSLLKRGVQLGTAVESWEQSGIWIVSRSDNDYPARYRTHLVHQAPPLLFGVGDKNLLKMHGLGVVGSRNVDMQGSDFATYVGELCAKGNIPVVSGYARGVDQISMFGAMNQGGTAVGILAENLLKKSLEKYAREAIAEKRLVFISHCHPNARFQVGNAMARNKLIYALSNSTVVVNAEYKKGGTWSGAIEELNRKKPRPVFIRSGENIPKGNQKLLEHHYAFPWPDQISSDHLLEDLKNHALATQCARTSTRLLTPRLTVEAERPTLLECCSKEKIKEKLKKELIPSQKQTFTIADTFYDFAIAKILPMLEETQRPDKIAEKLNIALSQLKIWLQQAEKDGLVEKKARPVRYFKKNNSSNQPSC